MIGIEYKERKPPEEEISRYIRRLATSTEVHPIMAKRPQISGVNDQTLHKMRAGASGMS